MFCANCGYELHSGSNFCEKCGKSIDTVAEVSFHAEMRSFPIPARPSFKALRVINWVLAALIVFGGVMMILKAPTFIGAVFIVVLLSIFVGTWVISAISLSSDAIYLFGLNINLSSVQKRRSLAIATILNYGTVLFALLGVSVCLMNRQFPPTVIMIIIYLIPSVLNLKAFRTLKNWEISV